MSEDNGKLMDVIERIEEKVEEREENVESLREKLEHKRYQLDKVDSMESHLETMAG